MSSRTHTYNHTGSGSADIILKCCLYKNTLELLVFVDPVLFSLKWSFRSNLAANGFDFSVTAVTFLDILFCRQDKMSALNVFCKPPIRSKFVRVISRSDFMFISSLFCQVAEETVAELHPGNKDCKPVNTVQDWVSTFLCVKPAEYLLSGPWDNF